VHIPLVAFAISFAALVPFLAWLGHCRGGELYLTLVRRYSKVMVTLFAVGVITGTVLSFEMGMLWPTFTATFGSVFGRRFAIAGLLLLPEGDLHRDLHYGWRPTVTLGTPAQRDPDRDHGSRS
jgi:cytochrome bd ubiquinol oxidase subunit I